MEFQTETSVYHDRFFDEHDVYHLFIVYHQLDCDQFEHEEGISIKCCRGRNSTSNRSNRSSR
jgi:hypothetical protein